MDLDLSNAKVYRGIVVIGLIVIVLLDSLSLYFNESAKKKSINISEEFNPAENTIIFEKGECEYVLFYTVLGTGPAAGITHRENCRFCEARDIEDTEKYYEILE